MNFLPVILSALLIVTLSTTGFCKETGTVRDSSQSIVQEEFLKTLNGLPASMEGTTPEGNSYKLYGIKVKKEWAFLIVDSTDFYTLKQEKGKEEVVETTRSFTDLVAMMIKVGLIKKVNKPKLVSGLTFSCYYKLKPNAKKIYLSVTKIEKKALMIKNTVEKGKWKKLVKP
jgi:hypothetical protein